MKKLLITGINGFLGWNICQLAQAKWELVGTVFSQPVEISGAKVLRTDLTEFKELKRLFQETNPDMVIHTAAMTDPNRCQEHRLESNRINIEAPANIAGLSADRGIPCVFTSSDLVFDGLNPPYSEDTPVSPVSFYGEQKVLAESRMMERNADVVICRMPLMFGAPGPVAKSFIQPMINAMMAGDEIRLFVDEFRTPVSGITAAEGIILAVERGAKGIIHLGGRERISRYEFGKLLSDLMDFPQAKLVACRQSDVPMSAPRPPDVSLDSSKAFELGYDPKPLNEQLKQVCETTSKTDL